MPTPRPQAASGAFVSGTRWPLLIALLGLAVVFAVFVGAAFQSAKAESWSSGLRFSNPFGACQGDCAVHVSFGRLVGETMTASIGLNDQFLPDAGHFVAPWNYDFEDSFLVSAALSWQLFSAGLWMSGSIEGGVGQRFGDMRAREVWAAFYLRWHAFPWNDILRTRVGISTGLNYATQIEAWECANDDKRKGAHLLHYLAPELSLALPQMPAWEMVVRYHHRSGGGALFGDTVLFKGVTGASNHVMVGLRRAY